MSTETQTLLDRHEIQDVRSRLARALDTRDWEAFRNLFTDQVDVDLPQLGAPKGVMTPEQLCNLFQSAFRLSQETQQLYSNFLVDLDADQARLTSSLLGHHQAKGVDGGDEVTLRARYLDQLVRTPQGWKITGMTISAVSLSGNPRIFG